MKTLPLTPYSLREWLREGAGQPAAHSRVLIVYQRLKTTQYQHERQQLLIFVFFADLVVMAERLHPIPFRTRP